MEKFKYLGVAFTSDKKLDKELDVRLRKESDVMRTLNYLVVLKREQLRKAKFSLLYTSPSSLIVMTLE